MVIFSIQYLIFVLFLIFGLGISIFFIKRNPSYIKGKLGERFVKNQLNKLDKNHYRILNNLLLPTQGEVQTTQIDHVVISNYGIFCIETKNRMGSISGSWNSKDWLQKNGNYEQLFHSPSYQNHAHKKAIENLISQKYPEVPIISRIVFPVADKINITGTNIAGWTKDTISEINNYTLPKISDADRDEIVMMLKKSNIAGLKRWKAIKEHNEQIRRKIKNSR